MKYVSSHAALQVAQEAVTILAKWAESKLPAQCKLPENDEVIKQAKSLVKWPIQESLKTLRLLFDNVTVPNGEGQTKQHYWPAYGIADTDPKVPYPYEANAPTDEGIDDLKLQVKNAVFQLEDNWDNLAFLMLFLEKYASYLSFGDEHIAFIDMVKSTAAVAAVLAKNPQAENFSLIAGGLSGIQDFIYNISSDGALKSLRARSFYLELVTEELVEQVLQKMDLPRTNVIYAGGSNLYILADTTKKIEEELENIRKHWNEWFIKEFQGKIFFALDYFNFPAIEVASGKFAEHWASAGQKRDAQKSRKFEQQLSNFLKPREAHDPCKVCHRDDVEPGKLKPLNNEVDSALACSTCRTMFDLGGELLKVEAIVRSTDKDIAGKQHTISFKLPKVDNLEPINIYYHVFRSEKPIGVGSDKVLLVNNWNLKDYSFKLFKNPVPLLLGNYAKESEKNDSTFQRSEEMVEAANGITRLGYLQMDVDKLGSIIHKGLGENQTLPALAGLSRLLTYFFKVYLNSLAEHRHINLPPEGIEKISNEERNDLLFIYAGGDDLFVSGAWNQLVEFAFDVYQCFRAFTGNHPDITLSGGISLATTKYPIYKAADEAKNAEKQAKNNDRDSLGLFGEVLKWGEWIGRKNHQVSEIKLIKDDVKNYLKQDIALDLYGVLPFVEIMMNESLKLETNYARSFVRNLLATAAIQDKMIKDLKEERCPSPYSNYEKDIRYFLHLPKIAYTLQRLPKSVREHPQFEPVRKSLLSPYNAPYFRAIATWIELLSR